MATNFVNCQRRRNSGNLLEAVTAVFRGNTRRASHGRDGRSARLARRVGCESAYQEALDEIALRLDGLRGAEIGGVSAPPDVPIRGEEDRHHESCERE